MLILSLLIKEVNWIHYVILVKTNDLRTFTETVYILWRSLDPSPQVKSFVNTEPFNSRELSLNFKDVPCVFVLKFWGI